MSLDPPRCTPTEIAEIFSTALVAEQVQAFIDDADAWIDAHLTTLGTLTDPVLKRISKYLTCYFITLRDPRLTEQRVDDTSSKFQRTDENEYLKAAISFDSTGTIAAELLYSNLKPVRWRVGEGYPE